MFCTNCGTQVGPETKFCPSCGSAQTNTASNFTASNLNSSSTFNAAPSPNPKGPDRQLTSIFCYLPGLGWIAAIYGLAADRFRLDRLTRFHAFQGLYLFLFGLIIEQVLEPLFSSLPGHRVLFRIVDVGLVIAGIYMMIQTGTGHLIRLPLLGDLADRSVDEQFPTRP